MDASTLHQYRFVQLFLGAGLVAGMLAVALPRTAGTGTGGLAEPARDETGVALLVVFVFVIVAAAPGVYAVRTRTL